MYSARIGMAWMLSSAAFLAIGNSLVRPIALELHPFQIGFLTNLAILFLVWPSLRKPAPAESRVRRRKLYAITAAIGGITNLTWFYALECSAGGGDCHHLRRANSCDCAGRVGAGRTRLGSALDGRDSRFHGRDADRPARLCAVDLGVVAVLISTCGMASTYLISKRITSVDARRARPPS